MGKHLLGGGSQGNAVRKTIQKLRESRQMTEKLVDSFCDEQHEQREVNGMLKRFFAYWQEPAVKQQLDEIEGPRTADHCRWCARKRLFVLCVQTQAIVADIREGQERAAFTVWKASRVPARYLANVQVGEAAIAFTQWEYERPGAVHPTWYGQLPLQPDDHE